MFILVTLLLPGGILGLFRHERKPRAAVPEPEAAE
jgi:hypothetical protein